MDEKTKRPAIPEQIQRELWARAAGRCEFRGCNELLYKDSLTQKQSNLAKISHIVAFRPGGPRGHTVRSKALEKAIINLMLTCHKHGLLIDNKALEGEYTEELLLEFKAEHETRVRMLTEAMETAQTHVLLLQVPIDTQTFEIDPIVAFRAILPKYPAEETPMCINLNGMAIPAVGEGYFSIAAESIAAATRDCLRRSSSSKPIRNLSVFALAPVPLLMHFGHILGDIGHVDLYQRHRDSQDWTWKTSEMEEEESLFYDIFLPDETLDAQQGDVVLLLSISNHVNHKEVVETLGFEPIIYELQARVPSLDFLRSRKPLESFGYDVRRLFETLHHKHTNAHYVHVFAAVPAPVAIEFGRNIKQHLPPFKIYQFDKATRKHIPALVINGSIRQHTISPK